MNRIYYNPQVYTPTKHIDWVHEIESDSAFYELEKRQAYANEAAVLEENFEGPVTYWEDNKLMHGKLYPEWLYEICPDNAVVQWGINWGDIIALNKEQVAAKYKEIFPSHELDTQYIQYDEQLGTYSIHVHYNGRY